MSATPRTQLGLMAIGMLIPFVLLGRPAGLPPGFPLDDAWIHMVYGRSLASEGLLAYNPGVPSSGCTAPLWAVCVGLAHLLLGWISTSAVVVGVKVAGFACHVLTATRRSVRLPQG